MTEKTVHEGRNVKRIREMFGIKQDALAFDLGISQQAISLLEQREVLDKDMLEKIAKILKVPAEAFRHFSDEAAINFMASTFNDNSSATVNNNPVFNPLEKYLEAIEEIKKLYERLLLVEREKIALLEKMIDKK